MPNLEVYGNPGRKRRRRRSLTAKQRAAGFGGKRGMARRRKRRNPGLATLAAVNPRRRRRSYYSKPRSRRRYRRNPGLGNLGGIFKMIDLPSAAWTAGGMIGVKAIPGLVQSRLWAGLPTSGPMGYLTKIATAALLGMVAGMVGQRRRAQEVVTGALAATLFDAYNEFAAPMFGLSGFVSTDELEDLGVSGFIKSPMGAGMGRMSDIPSEILAA